MATLNRRYIQQLLSSPEPEFKRVGMQQLIGGLPDTSDVALDYLVQCPDEEADVFSKNLRRHLPFLRPGFATPPQATTASFDLFSSTQKSMEVFLASLRRLLAEGSVSQPERLLKRLSGFPGIAREVQQLVGEFWGAAQKQAYVTLVWQAQKNFVQRQLMLFVSYACNLHCSYCFARGRQEADIPLKKALSIFDWAQGNGVTTLTFCGGEPTIYPQFPTLLDELRTRGLKTYFATNLLAAHGVLERLQPPVVDALIVHVAHRDTYKEHQWSAFQKNMGMVVQQEVPIALRINLYAKNHDWSHLFRLAEKFGLQEVHLALTFPDSQARNRCVQVKDFAAFIPAVLQLIESLHHAGLRTVFSKPLPLCLFPESMRYEMLSCRNYPSTCSLFMDEYTHNVCISPEGNVSPCLALLDISRPFSQFHNWEELATFCRSKTLPLLKQPLLPQCSACFLFARHLCQGACLGHKRTCY